MFFIELIYSCAFSHYYSHHPVANPDFELRKAQFFCVCIPVCLPSVIIFLSKIRDCGGVWIPGHSPRSATVINQVTFKIYWYIGTYKGS